MKCENCGAKIKSSAKFCDVCGQKVEYQTKIQKVENNPNAKKKFKIITISIFSGVFATLIILAVLLFTSPAYSVLRDMNSGDYEDAAFTYRIEVKGSFVQENVLKFLLKDRVNQIIENYMDDELGLEDIISGLRALSEMDFKDAKENLEEYEIEYNSDIYLKNGKDYYNTGDYKSAIFEYNKISKSWTSYDEVLEELEKAYNGYIEQMCKSAEILNKKEKYTEAIQILNEAYTFLPSDIDKTKIDNIKKEVLDNYKINVENKDAELIE